MTDDLGARIKQARARRGLTQKQLARAIDTSDSTISKIESGLRAVKSVELADIADALGVSMRDLLGRRKPLAPLALSHRLAEASPDSPSAQKAKEHFRHLLEVHALLDELEIPDAPTRDSVVGEVGPSSTDPVRAGEEVAEAVRTEMGLGASPMPSLPEALERLGVDVVGIPLGEDDEVLSGACVRASGLRAALVNTSKWLTHQRFTLAHELAHLLFDDPSEEEFYAESAQDQRRSDPRETRANAFAAAFLLPAEALTAWPVRGASIDESAFTDMLFTFKVSVRLLAYRLHNLGIFDAADRDEACAWKPSTLARRHNRMQEFREMAADRDDDRAPTRLYERALRAYCESRIGIGPLAGILRRDPEELRAELAEEGFAPDFDDAGDDVLAML